MKKYKKVLFILSGLLLGGALYGYYLFNKQPADIRKVTANYALSTTSLVAAFNADETAANALYVDKVIAVKGKIASVSVDANQATVFLDSGDPLVAVTCSFYDEEARAARSLQKGKIVTIKGKCTGKLMDVVLNKCSVAE